MCLSCLKFVNFFENLLLISPNLNLSYLQPCLSLKVGQKHYYRFFKICFLLDRLHYLKSVRIRSFSSPNFPAFGLNTEKYGVSLRIQSKCGKIQARKTPNTDTFHAASNSSTINWWPWSSVLVQKITLAFTFTHTAWKVSRWGVFFVPNTGKYRPEKTPYLDTFHAVVTLN